MRARPLVALAVALVLARIGTSIVVADFIDQPRSVAADRDGNVHVSFVTDVLAGMLRRYTPGAKVIAHTEWGRYTTADVVAEAPDGGVYGIRADPIHQDGVDDVIGYSSALTETVRWPVVGLLPVIATGPTGRSLRPTIYVLADDAGGRGVKVFAADGSPAGGFVVDPTASMLTVTPALEGAPQGLVYVADAEAPTGKGHVVRYSTDGARLADWIVPGQVSGIDADRGGGVWLALHASGGDAVYRLDPTLGALERWQLPAAAAWLSVAPNGEVYVVAGSGFEKSVYRYDPDGCLLAIWTPAVLNELAEPEPPPAACAPSPTPPVATSTPTGAVQPTATTVGSSTPDGPATPSGAPAVAIYLPRCERGPRE